MEKYQIQRPSGDGTFGQVFKAINKQTGEQVAIKNMKRKFQNWEECVNLREVKALRKLIHPNIVRLKEVVKSNDELNLVFDYFDNNIYQLYMSYRKKKQQMPEQLIRSIAKQIVEGLAYMHENGFFHRDLKPENLMWSNNQVKIIDFGLTREIRSRPPFTDYVSTRWYRAPELLVRSTTYNSPVDIFAFGCILAELYNLNPIFCGNSEFDQLTKIFSIMGTPNQQNWGEGHKQASKLRINFPQYEKKNLPRIIPAMCPEGIDLLEQIFQYDSSKRPTALEILNHAYFKNFDLETGQRIQNYGNQHNVKHLPAEIYQLEQNMINKIGEMRHSNNNQIDQNTKKNYLQDDQIKNQNNQNGYIIKNVQDIEQFRNNQFNNNNNQNHVKFKANQFNYVKANDIFSEIKDDHYAKEYQKVNNLKQPVQMQNNSNIHNNNNLNSHFNNNAYNIINNNNNQNIGTLDPISIKNSYPNQQTVQNQTFNKNQNFQQQSNQQNNNNNFQNNNINNQNNYHFNTNNNNNSNIVNQRYTNTNQPNNQYSNSFFMNGKNNIINNNIVGSFRGSFQGNTNAFNQVQNNGYQFKNIY